MSRESDFIERLRPLARVAAARGLLDDAAVLPIGDRQIVLTHDMLVEGIHYLPDDPPEDIAWKLVAVNLSDLAAKGARPLGVLLGYALGDEAYDQAFLRGLQEALTSFDVPLLGGDTVQMPAGSARAYGLTAIGEAGPAGAPARSGAQAGDLVYVTGNIGLAGLGLHVAQGKRDGPPEWLRAYRRPQPRLAEGAALAPLVHAMADISDGLLIDVQRMASASGLAAEVELFSVPVPDELSLDERLAAISAGDDYELLFAAPANFQVPHWAFAPITPVGRFKTGHGLRLLGAEGEVIDAPRLGYEHGGQVA